MRVLPNLQRRTSVGKLTAVSAMLRDDTQQFLCARVLNFRHDVDLECNVPAPLGC